LKAAAAEFADKGFAGARIDAIAHRAHMNKAILYYHVGNKRDLYCRVILEILRVARARLTEAVATADTAADKLHALVVSLATSAAAMPSMPRIMMREIASGALNLPDEVLSEMAGVFGMVQGLLREGKKAGEFRDIDELKTHILIIATTILYIVGAPVRERIAERMGLRIKRDENPHEIADYMAELLLHGIAVPPGR